MHVDRRKLEFHVPDRRQCHIVVLSNHPRQFKAPNRRTTPFFPQRAAKEKKNAHACLVFEPVQNDVISKTEDFGILTCTLQSTDRAVSPTDMVRLRHSHRISASDSQFAGAM